MKIFQQNKNLEIKDITFKYKLRGTLLILLSLCLLALLFSFTMIKPEVVRVPVYLKTTDTIRITSDIKLNDSSIVSELVKNKCILPAVALAQAKLESSHFKSAITFENKNIFGIRTSTSEFVKRDSKGNIIKNKDHNVYDTYILCIKDYIRIQNRYLASINGRYAQSSNYIETLKSIKK